MNSVLTGNSFKIAYKHFVNEKNEPERSRLFNKLIPTIDNSIRMALAAKKIRDIEEKNDLQQMCKMQIFYKITPKRLSKINNLNAYINRLTINIVKDYLKSLGRRNKLQEKIDHAVRLEYKQNMFIGHS